MIARELLTGGLRIEAHKQRSTQASIRAASLTEHYVIPLDQHSGVPAVPLVKRGDRVRMWQPIAQPAPGISAWLHSPVSGEVIAIEPRPAPAAQSVARGGRDRQA